VVLVLVDDELYEFFVVYMFNFAHISVAVTARFPRDVCMNLMCLPFISRFTVHLVCTNLMCVWYGSRFTKKQKHEIIF
jgi:hypothetical protein